MAMIETYAVKVFAVGSGREIGQFDFPRVPVKGDIIDLVTHDPYEVVRVTMYDIKANDAYVATIQVKRCGYELDPKG